MPGAINPIEWKSNYKINNDDDDDDNYNEELIPKIINNEDYDENYDENYGEDYNEQTFCISRHLNSCNNIIDSLGESIFKKIHEPSLSLWGIISGLALIREPEEKDNFKGIVYVSCLVRTWMTSILEYFPYTYDNELKLIVSPYIKEKHISKTIDKGNMPINLDEQMMRLINFFDYLKMLNEFLKMYSKTITLENEKDKIKHVENIKNKLNKILTDGNKIHIIIPNLKSSIETNDESLILVYRDRKLIIEERNISNNDPYSEEINKTYNVSLERNIIKRNEQSGVIHLGGYNRNDYKNYANSVLDAFTNQYKNYDYKEINLYPNEYNEKISENIQPRIKLVEEKLKGFINKKLPKITPYTDYFGKEGILLFINWIKINRQDNNPYIYVVCHSNIMQSSVYNFCEILTNQTNIKKKNVDERCMNGIYNIVKNHNIWELVIKTSENNDNKYYNVNEIKIRSGQEKPNRESIRKLNYSKEINCMMTTNNLIEQNLNQQSQILNNNGINPIDISEPEPRVGFFTRMYRKLRGKGYSTKKIYKKNKTRHNKSRHNKTRHHKTRHNTTRHNKTRHHKSRHNKNR